MRYCNISYRAHLGPVSYELVVVQKDAVKILTSTSSLERMKEVSTHVRLHDDRQPVYTGLVRLLKKVKISPCKFESPRFSPSFFECARVRRALPAEFSTLLTTVFAWDADGITESLRRRCPILFYGGDSVTQIPLWPPSI